MADDFIAGVRELVDSARRIGFLTGAGISTGAGIPDFRGPEGVWTKNPNMERISTLDDYLTDDDVRRLAWQVRANSPAWEASPTPAHRVLVELERAGRLVGITTQNTDGLHQLAGSSTELVHEIHGSMRRWRCEDCGAWGDMAEMRARVLAGDADPRCPACGGITRATVILFGEGLVGEVVDAAARCAEECDLYVTVGTSLAVFPAAGLVPTAVGNGARLLIINAEPTGFDDLADAVVRDDIQQVVPTLFGAVT